MELERQWVVVTALCILLVTFAAGPLVPGIGGTEPADESVELYTSFAGNEEGVSVERQLFVSPTRVPAENLTLEQPTTDAHRLEVPDALVYVETGAEPVAITYRVSVPELNYTGTSTESVAAGTERTVPLSIPGETVAGPDNSSVEATVAVAAESDGAAFTVTEETVALEVER
ncbi:hypothetical protein [Natrinema salaciae]|uniref:Uncharacterized protein n=1 Tax=Natrinema salaciae TaxID=1186196 RepID=A0A1H9M849_9EURY|nr:hypothetical protein [Natrinema salaciae]SER19741.1 hypothetical protein SAMN04489841_3241 [Natrinema salaciae]